MARTSLFRRNRTPLILAAVIFFIIFYLWHGESTTRNSDFFVNTKEALEVQQKAQAEAHAQNVREMQQSQEVTRSRLSAAEEAAKRAANDKHQKYLDSVEGGEGQGVAGRVKLPPTATDKKFQGVATLGGNREEIVKQEGESLAAHEVEQELTAIMKKSPSTSTPSPPLHLLGVASGHPWPARPPQQAPPGTASSTASRGWLCVSMGHQPPSL